MTDQTEDTDNETAAFAKALFAKDEPDEPAPPDPATANHVPGEGNNPATHADAADMQEFIRALFAPDPDA